MRLLLCCVMFSLLSQGALAQNAPIQSAAQPAPIQMQQSNTTASLRGIHAAGPGVAWASGTNGTVLRTEDAGFVWQGCSMPPGAEKLDFRGVWAWDAMTAIVMSSGPGDQSRLYKTTDGCATWKLLLTNPEKDGFWDAIAFSDTGARLGYLLGDPVAGKTVLLYSSDRGEHWKSVRSSLIRGGSDALDLAGGKAGFYAASNSAMVLVGQGPEGGVPWIGSASAPSDQPGSKSKRVGPFVIPGVWSCTMTTWQTDIKACTPEFFSYVPEEVPMANGNDASGVFSLASRSDKTAVAVGGDYTKPASAAGTAAWTSDSGNTWTSATTPPHGYRSAVAYELETEAWITAGPNGTDYSRDDGKTWIPLENGAWNAISLPYLVGPGGRIGKLVSLPQAGAQQARRPPVSKTGTKTR